MAGVKVVVKGPGVSVSARTGRNGVARLTFRPRAAGAIQVSLAQASSCAVKSRVLPVVPEVFKPPSPVFTG
jgi:hypothetical protein